MGGLQPCRRSRPRNVCEPWRAPPEETSVQRQAALLGASFCLSPSLGCACSGSLSLREGYKSMIARGAAEKGEALSDPQLAMDDIQIT